MNSDLFIKSLYQSLIKEDGEIYQDLFLNTEINEVIDSYWKDALKMFSELSVENKEVLFKIIEQVKVESIANVLGVLDGVVSLQGQDIDINMTIEGSDEKVNGDLQDLFFETDEENR
ncbi:transposase [Bacillus sp. RG28]|uniref:Transposase n=1 Tax=Gottfriedia endophytica TaxID=2820819 RepID=A0A940NRR6_9BACI|nr:transposase [Gottfriedia endophytica]MBP0725812.1 transposase [Gottfriedia endophytica]